MIFIYIFMIKYIFYDVFTLAFLNVFQRLNGETQMAGPDFVR